MANTLTQVIPQIMAQSLPILRESAVMPRLVNTSFGPDTATRGSTVHIPINAASTARAITAAITPAANQDLTPTHVDVTLANHYEATFNLTDKDAAEAMSGYIPRQLQECVKAIGNEIDKTIIALHSTIYQACNEGHAPGTTPFGTNINIVASGRKQLNAANAALDNRYAVIDPSAEANMILLGNLLNTYQRGDTSTIKEGSIGRILGFDWYMNQNVASTTYGTGWVTGYIASTVGCAVADTTINLINATASGTILVGDVFKSGAGIYTISVADTVTSTVAVAVTFAPAMATAVATGDAITVGASFTPNLLFHRDAIVFASRVLTGGDAGVGNVQSIVDPVTGVALSFEVTREYYQTTWRVSSLWGTKVARAALASKLVG